MYRSYLAMVAEGLSIDAATGTATAYSIYDVLSAPGFPTFIHALFFLTFLERSVDDPASPPGSLSVAIDGEALFSAPVGIDFKSETRCKVAVRIGGVVIPRPGRLAFSLSVEGRGVVAEQVLPVHLFESSVVQTQLPFVGQSRRS